MAYKITDACVNCGASNMNCAVVAIIEQGNVRVIDADTCVSCGACSAACPTEAIIED